MADLIFAAVIIIFTVAGAKKGLMRSLVSVLSLLISMLAGSFLYRPVSSVLLKSGAGDKIREAASAFIEQKASGQMPGLVSQGAGDAAAAIAVNALSFFAIMIIVRIVLLAISGVCDFASKLPVIKQANKLLGAVLGFVGGVLICYLVIMAVSYAAPSGMLADFANVIKESPISGMFFKNIAV